VPRLAVTLALAFALASLWVFEAEAEAIASSSDGYVQIIDGETLLALAFDDDGQLRLITPIFTFESLANAAFDPNRRSARGHVGVSVRLLETLTVVGGATGDREIRRLLRRHASRIAAGAREATPDADDLETVEARYRAAAAALSETA
jgi:uncharacterized membrane protein